METDKLVWKRGRQNIGQTNVSQLVKQMSFTWTTIVVHVADICLTIINLLFWRLATAY